eukprot:7379964-Prymnesium_polylepis.1
MDGDNIEEAPAVVVWDRYQRALAQEALAASGDPAQRDIFSICQGRRFQIKNVKTALGVRTGDAKMMLRWRQRSRSLWTEAEKKDAEEEARAGRGGRSVLKD